MTFQAVQKHAQSVLVQSNQLGALSTSAATLHAQCRYSDTAASYAASEGNEVGSARRRPSLTFQNFSGSWVPSGNFTAPHSGTPQNTQPTQVMLRPSGNGYTGTITLTNGQSIQIDALPHPETPGDYVFSSANPNGGTPRYLGYLRSSEQGFYFQLLWREGTNDQGWTMHMRPAPQSSK